MFTGLIEECGRVKAFERSESGYRLVVEAKAVLEDLELGDSIAVDGCCLTGVEWTENSITFDLLEETIRCTHFADLKVGMGVNLERSLRYGGKMGGHFVSGHIDTVGEVRVFEERGDVYLRIAVPERFERYLISKGSIAIDGISLTVAEICEGGFAVCLIPHTLEVTTMSDYVVGRRVNLEFDLLGKYVERLVAPYGK